MRRKKVYCDKWVHEGVCAFTQQGCRYKHEMPMDRATQLKLGLNNGLPLWWRRQQSLKLQSTSSNQSQDYSRSTDELIYGEIPAKVEELGASEALVRKGEHSIRSSVIISVVHVD